MSAVVYQGNLLDFYMTEVDEESVLVEMVKLRWGGYQFFLFFLTGPQEGKRFHGERFFTGFSAVQAWNERTGKKLTVDDIHLANLGKKI
jgi:hypothetical protein